MKAQNIKNVDIKFPWGVLRRAEEFRDRLFFIDNDTLKRNLAYHFLLTDFYRWILNRFDIKGTAKEMVIKEGICLYGNICGAILVRATRKITKRKGIKPLITFLVNLEIIDADLGKELKWLWGVRNKEHLESLKDWEFQKYELAQYNRATMTWQKLEEKLKNARQEELI